MKRFILKSGGVPDNELPTSNLERSEEAPAVPESLFNVGSWTLSVGRSFWPLGAALTYWPGLPASVELSIRFSNIFPGLLIEPQWHAMTPRTPCIIT